MKKAARTLADPGGGDGARPALRPTGPGQRLPFARLCVTQSISQLPRAD